MEIDIFGKTFIDILMELPLECFFSLLFYQPRDVSLGSTKMTFYFSDRKINRHTTFQKNLFNIQNVLRQDILDILLKEYINLPNKVKKANHFDVSLTLEEELILTIPSFTTGTIKIKIVEISSNKISITIYDPGYEEPEVVLRILSDHEHCKVALPVASANEGCCSIS
jgi:hypothetical protein